VLGFKFEDSTVRRDDVGLVNFAVKTQQPRLGFPPWFLRYPPGQFAASLPPRRRRILSAARCWLCSRSTTRSSSKSGDAIAGSIEARLHGRNLVRRHAISDATSTKLQQQDRTIELQLYKQR
jgi:hypothetical protein